MLRVYASHAKARQGLGAGDGFIKELIIMTGIIITAIICLTLVVLSAMNKKK
jgi:hypothetical protein